MNAFDFDRELAAGRVSKEAFQALWDAECYGTATPMQWLKKRLWILFARAKEGKEIQVVSAAGHCTIRGEAEFLAWCKESFRDAYWCFFANY